MAYFLRERQIDTRLAYTLCQAPVDLGSLKKHPSGKHYNLTAPSASLIQFSRYVDHLLKYNKAMLFPGLNASKTYHRSLRTTKHIKYFQDLHFQLSLYQWLYHKFHDAFQDMDACLRRLEQCSLIIDEILHSNR